MTEHDLSELVEGVVTKASEGANGGLLLSVATERGTFILQAEACQCGKPCDLTHIHLTKVNGYDGQ